MAKEAAVRSPAIYDPFFGARFDSSGQSRVVLIGDASHGTPEFYEARAEITNRLIEHHGSTTVAFEADWPEAKAVDRYVRQNLSDKTSPDLGMFKHSPQWMWRNSETREFVNWLRRHNAQQPSDKRASFNGLDLYTLGLSMRKVIEYLDKVDPKTANVARQTCGSLEPWADDRAEYGREVFRRGMASCEGSVVKMLTDLPKKRLEYAAHDGEDLSDAGRNARLERDTHLFNTLVRLLQHRKGPKAVVWAHNSHVGDARYTDMGEKRTELNIGQSCREQFGASCSITGCGSHTGTIDAVHEWDGPMEVMKVHPSREDSYERVMHGTGSTIFLLGLHEGHQEEEVRKALMEKRRERFIGVIYRPRTETIRHHSRANLPRQLESLMGFNKLLHCLAIHDNVDKAAGVSNL